jgi:hypothetical protein
MRQRSRRCHRTPGTKNPANRPASEKPAPRASFSTCRGLRPGAARAAGAAAARPCRARPRAHRHDDATARGDLALDAEVGVRAGRRRPLRALPAARVSPTRGQRETRGSDAPAAAARRPLVQPRAPRRTPGALSPDAAAAGSRDQGRHLGACCKAARRLPGGGAPLSRAVERPRRRQFRRVEVRQAA